jgi:uncharacterized protein
VSSTDLQLIRRLYEVWNGPAGMRAALDLFDPSVEYVNPEGAVEPGTRHGHAGIVGVLQALDSAFSDYTHELHELIDGGDRVVALTTFKACGRDSGAWVEVPEQHVWTLRNGRIVRIEWFHDERKAKKAAGL